MPPIGAIKPPLHQAFPLPPFRLIAIGNLKFGTGDSQVRMPRKF